MLVQAEGHLLNDSVDGAGIFAGLTPLPLGLDSTDVTVDAVRSWVERSAGGRVQTPIGVISIESPVRRRTSVLKARKVGLIWPGATYGKRN